MILIIQKCVSLGVERDREKERNLKEKRREVLVHLNIWLTVYSADLLDSLRKAWGYAWQPRWRQGCTLCVINYNCKSAGRGQSFLRAECIMKVSTSTYRERKELFALRESVWWHVNSQDLGDRLPVRQRQPLKTKHPEARREVYSKYKQHGRAIPQIFTIVWLYLQNFTLNLMFALRICFPILINSLHRTGYNN